MAMKNTANYRVGKGYKLEVKDYGVVPVVVMAKGDHKLQLKMSDGKIEWFNNEQLSPAKSQPKETKISEVKVEVKPPTVAQVAKSVTSKKSNVKVVTKKEHDWESTNLDLRPDEERPPKFWEYQFGSFLLQVKTILIKKGYGTEVKYFSSRELINFIGANIKSPNGK